MENKVEDIRKYLKMYNIYYFRVSFIFLYVFIEYCFENILILDKKNEV